MADNIFGEGNVGYAGDLLTMRGPAGQRQRRRLQPGMRLADGTIYTGNSQIAGLEARAVELQEKIAKSQQELAATMEKIKELKGPVQDVAVLTGATLGASEPVISTSLPADEVAQPKGEEEVVDVSTPISEQLHEQPRSKVKGLRRPGTFQRKTG